ncbi:MAG: DUF3868 domain-containing protein [Candidatus Azobacteroides sp.]|nr:DUF3868 domain-containing protein [Candidatus Azobacteroides sp.]
MKLRNYNISTAIILCLLFLGSFQMYGQSTFKGLIQVRTNQVQPNKGTVYLDWDVILNGVDVSSKNQLTLTPVVRASNGQSRALPSIVVNGKGRQNLYKRSLNLKGWNNDPTVYRVVRADKRNVVLSIPYKTSFPYERWMQDAAIYLTADLCGCAGSEKAHEDLLISKDLGHPTLKYEYTPGVQFIVPPREAIKARVKDGQAYVIFEQSKWEILPRLFDNRAELEKIRNSLTYVREEPTAKIDAISIVAYASPEGTYENNMMLSKNRAKALLDYVKSHYDIPSSVSISSEGRGENWDDLIPMVQDDPQLAEYRDQILRIIRTVDIFDGREKQLMDLGGGRPYLYMLNNLFPLVRRSDYKISYTVPSFTIEKGKLLIQTKPEMLSVEEMYLIANTYEKGSPEFNQVFEIAAQKFPDDMIACINAAGAYIIEGKIGEAKRLLEPYADEPQAWNNLGLVCMAEYKFPQAEAYFQEAKRRGCTEADYNLSVLPELKKAYEDYQRAKAGYNDFSDPNQ